MRTRIPVKCLKTKGLELADKIPGIECLIVVREKDGKYTDYSSKGFTNNQKNLFE